MKEAELLSLALACLLLLFSAHFFGRLLALLKMPRVAGEILGGIIVGPSLLGYFFPDAHNSIFSAFPAEKGVLGFAYWTALVFYMFSAGLQMAPEAKRSEFKLVGFSIVGSLLPPLLIVMLWGDQLLGQELMGSAQNWLALKLITGIALAVASIPVISKIFMDLNLIHTRLARVVLSVAIVEDIVLWVLLAMALSLAAVSGANSISTALLESLKTCVFFGLSLTAFTKGFQKLSALPSFIQSRHRFLAILLLFYSLLGLAMGVNLVLAAFVAGISYSRCESQSRYGAASIHSITSDLFGPLYFCLVGFKIAFPHSPNYSFILLFTLAACVLKFVSIFLSSKAAGEPTGDSVDFAFALNARGGPGIVVASLAYEYKIVSDQYYLALLTLAILSSTVAGTWLRFRLGKIKA